MDLSKILSILAGVTLPLAVICVGAWLIYQARQNLRSPDATESDVLEDLENAYRGERPAPGAADRPAI